MALTGSYAADDCRFLLTPLAMDYVDVADKEALIQSGQRHYSEMISYEAPPTPRYMALFRELTARYKRRLAREVMALAQHIAQTRPAPLTIVSLARAGTPVGALLNRALNQSLGVASAHYSISIIRDRGIDTCALAHLLRTLGRPAAGLVFVDAWTAKGVITRELKSALAQWNATEPEQLDDRLYVVSDIGGSADVAATRDDYAIPSGVLNAPVSGLVSRSILNERVPAGAFHGCVVYTHLADCDQTGWFLDQVSALFDPHEAAAVDLNPAGASGAAAQAWVRRLMDDFAVTDINHIKPGVAEATRVMLRRVPERLLLADPASPDVAHLRMLAEEKQVPMEVMPGMPFQAAALIKAVLR